MPDRDGLRFQAAQRSPASRSTSTNAVRILQVLLERPETAGSTFALVGSETFTLRALLERLLAGLGRRPILPLTREEVRLLRTDKVANGLPTPAALGIAARPLGKGLPVSLYIG
jgi:hypothetical protein